MAVELFDKPQGAPESAAETWGLPDWRNREAYGDHATWSEVRWRWEFTRRRPDVRAAFEELAGPTRESMLETPEYADRDPELGELPSDPGFWAMCPDGTLFSMIGIPNPAISDQPLLHNLFYGVRQYATIGKGNDPIDPDGWTIIGLMQREVAIVFDLTMPPNAQFEVARMTFEAARRRSGVKMKDRRPKSGKRLTYLRVLDARETGASWATIARDVLGLRIESGNGAPQQAREMWRAACALRDDWPQINLLPADFY